MLSRVYLDYNATAPLRTEARDAMIAAMDVVGNPSSVHAEGRAATALIERTRAQIAEALGCRPREVVFTAGATEAAQVLRHHTAEVDPTAHDALWVHHGGDGPPMKAIGLANSETGVISEIPTRAARDGVPLLLDITQAVGRIAFSFAWSDADLALLSAHKLGGPKGVGALIIREGLDVAPLSLGGGQEMGRRAGTQDVIGIAGFGAAIRAAMRDLEDGLWAETEKLRNILESSIEDSAPETTFVGNSERRLPNTTCALTPGWKGETQVMQMDLAGYAISAGSACSSGKLRESRVLKATGYTDAEAASAIRVSLGPRTSEAEVRGFVQSWLAAREKHRVRAA